MSSPELENHARDLPAPLPAIASSPERRFQAFDTQTGLQGLIPYIEQPIVHLLIEDKPSTAYNLPGFVLESKLTGEWFVFSRGRLALQGEGGGHRNMKAVVDLLREKQTKIVGWVIRQADMDQLEDGTLLWPEARKDIVPLLSYHVDDENWEWRGIKRTFDKLTGATIQAH